MDPPAILAEGQWHTAPVPVIEHDGRLWRAIEDAHGSLKWGERYRALMMSAPFESDLLDPASWTFSNPLPRDSAWLDGTISRLGLRAMPSPIRPAISLDMLRVDIPDVPEKAAIVRVTNDGDTATFDHENDFIDLPGGSKKFTIRKDPAGWWILVAGQHHSRSFCSGRPSCGDSQHTRPGVFQGPPRLGDPQHSSPSSGCRKTRFPVCGLAVRGK